MEIKILVKFKNFSIIPPGSFIAMDDFESPQALGKYLNYLLENQTAYFEYFKWRDEGWALFSMTEYSLEEQISNILGKLFHKILTNSTPPPSKSAIGSFLDSFKNFKTYWNFVPKIFI